MTDFRTLAAVCGGASLALALAGAASADGYEQASAPPPAQETRTFSYSFNIGATSDYVFRGVSQTDNDPTIQGGIDLGYGILYAGWWASGLDFDAGNNDAEVEMDWYAGVRPVWNHVTFDLGAIYYTYPNSNPIVPPGPDLPYWELKAGASGEIVKNLTAGLAIFWSPDYFAETGNTWTFEGSGGYAFHAFGPITPSITGVVGYQDGEDIAYSTFNGFNNYWYWNAGLVLAVEKIAFDFRYWGTNASNVTSDTLTCINDYCDSRFVFSAKVTLP